MIRTRFRHVLMVTAAVGLLGALTVAQGQGGADQRLQAARTKAAVEGKLDEAIKLYADVVAKYKADRPTVVRALIEMADCYEKLGQTKSRELYEQIVREYADQKEAAAEARTRLVALAALPSGEPGAASSRRLWTLPVQGDVDAISTDGRFVTSVAATTDGNEIRMHDLLNGVDGKLSVGGLASSGAFSRDGRQFAFGWIPMPARTNARPVSKAELRIVKVSETEVPSPQRITLDAQWVVPLDWTADGRLVAAFVTRPNAPPYVWAVVLVSPATGESRELTDKVSGTGRGVFSPDGRYLAIDGHAYDMGVAKDLEAAVKRVARDVVMLNVATGGITARTDHPADDAVVGWSPDGTRLLFTSDRSGTVDLFAQRVTDGRFLGQPERVRANIGDGSPLGVDRSGAVYYSVTPPAVQPPPAIGQLDFSTGEWISAPATLAQPYRAGAPLVSVRDPRWSPDGLRLAYMARRGPGQSESLVIQALDGGDIKEYPLPPGVSGPVTTWSPDGRTLFGGRSAFSTFGSAIVAIDAATGTMQTLVPAEIHGRFHGLSGDGQQVYYDRPTGERPEAGGRSGAAFVARDRTTGAEREIARLLRNEAAGAVPIGGKLFYRKLPTDSGSGEEGVMERDIASGAERVLVRALWVSEFMVALNREWLAVALSDAAAGTRTIRVVPLTGGEPRELLQGPEASRLMLVSLAPDSRSLVVSKRPSAGAAPETWWVPIDGRSPKRLTGGGEAAVGGMTVHPDGRRVVLWSQAAQASRAEVWVLENLLPKATAVPGAKVK